MNLVKRLLIFMNEKNNNYDLFFIIINSLIKIVRCKLLQLRIDISKLTKDDFKYYNLI